MNFLEKIELIIFDCDGVLVDSEPIANRILAACVTELGWPMSTEDSMQHFMGRSIHCIIELIEERLSKNVPSNFVETFESRMFAAFTEELQPIAGIREVVAECSLPYCVASSAGHEKIRHALRTTDLLSHFEGRIYSAHDVARGKPAPDLFLHAAQCMSTAPEHCVVIEDSPFGIQAAHAAQMPVIAYAPHGDMSAHQPTMQIQDVRQVLTLIADT